MQRAASNESQLALSNVSLATAGKYSCEVSADSPSFHTLVEAGDLLVVGKFKENNYKPYSVFWNNPLDKNTCSPFIFNLKRCSNSQLCFLTTLHVHIALFFVYFRSFGHKRWQFAIFFCVCHLRNLDKHNFAAFCMAMGKLLKIVIMWKILLLLLVSGNYMVKIRSLFCGVYY